MPCKLWLNATLKDIRVWSQLHQCLESASSVGLFVCMWRLRLGDRVWMNVWTRVPGLGAVVLTTTSNSPQISVLHSLLWFQGYNQLVPIFFSVPLLLPKLVSLYPLHGLVSRVSHFLHYSRHVDFFSSVTTLTFSFIIFFTPSLSFLQSLPHPFYLISLNSMASFSLLPWLPKQELNQNDTDRHDDMEGRKLMRPQS